MKTAKISPSSSAILQSNITDIQFLQGEAQLRRQYNIEDFESSRLKLL